MLAARHLQRKVGQRGAELVRFAFQPIAQNVGGEAVLVASQPHAGGVRVTAALGTAGEDLAGLLDQGPGGRQRATLAACLEHHAVVPALRDLLLAGSAGSTPEATPAATLAALLTFDAIQSRKR